MAGTLSSDLLLLTALRAGLQQLVDDASLFDRTLRAYPSEQRARIRTRFLERKPSVHPAFARTSDPWPLWSVVLADRSPQEMMLGHRLGIEPAHGDHGAREWGYVSTQSVQIYLHCEHPDETRIHDLLCEACIFGQFLWMLEQGVTHIVPSGARDLRPDETYLPESVYSRVQTWEIGGLSVAYQALGVPRSVVYAHMTGITVDGHPGLIDPAAR